MPLKKLLSSQELHSVYQPIVDTYRSSIIGYESLIRGPVNHALASPLALFRAAEQENIKPQLENYCIGSAIENYNSDSFNGFLFINIDPNFLTERETVHFLLEQQALISSNIVLELSEQYPIEDIAALKRHVHALRTEGFRFAIDDLGAGHSSMKLWAEIRPEYVKIDRYFISDIHNNPYKKEFVQHIVTLAKNLHATVIAEGIECMEELRQLQRLGIFAMQGYFIGMPSPLHLPEGQIKHLLSNEDNILRDDSLEPLVEDTTVVDSERKVADLLDYFRQNKRLVAIPVVDHGVIKGIVRRGQFMELMSTPYGRALYAGKPIASVIQTNFLVIDVHSPIEQASALLTEHEDTLEQMVLLIVRQDEYAGIIPVPSLLRRITELRIQNARYANPLTLLPGNVPINQHIDQCSAANCEFSVLYFDLNNFKPYNDVYGYHQGDQIIQWFAQLLYETFTPKGHFVGHVGGDDFIVVVDEHEFEESLLTKLKTQFTQQIKDFYRPQHLEESSLFARSRDGQFKRFPLLDYSLAIVQLAKNSELSHQEVAALAAQLKSDAKRASNGIAIYTHSPSPSQQPQTSLANH
ncbi:MULTISPECIES: GGDEF domain-containing protein [Gammaproteobacteria]|uniref:GGDEF domain-containing protein n=1 Tax=Gammaproteobacteria TaxID=1236 RepID=UPI000DD063F5|nr:MULTISPECIES: GGDEF domain-containing protein [Gammaproteobacteria]RTE85840.1 GGDEF domain-containing protein [Aliidiomarina sp. B3213]TCZ90159.1 GGDEF domain-containing protein [Lysobacter sp. N42]